MKDSDNKVYLIHYNDAGLIYVVAPNFHLALAAFEDYWKDKFKDDSHPRITKIEHLYGEVIK